MDGRWTGGWLFLIIIVCSVPYFLSRVMKKPPSNFPIIYGAGTTNDDARFEDELKPGFFIFSFSFSFHYILLLLKKGLFLRR